MLQQCASRHVRAPAIIAASLVAGLWAASARAQTDVGIIAGTAVDETGGILANVDVTIVHLATGLTRNVKTSTDGSFTISPLPVGRYQLTARLAGFAQLEVRDIQLNINDRLLIKLQLKVEKIGETVTVTSEAVRVQSTPSVGTVVDRGFVESLPLNGRSFQALVALTPGVVVARATSDSAGDLSVNGQRTSANYFTVDGVSANIAGSLEFTLGSQAGGTLLGTSATGGTQNLVSVDAIEEFRIETSTFAPEFGRTPGAQVSIVTRSGTNELHGSLFEYFRHDALDATDWFVNRNGLSKPAMRQSDFGGVLGGRLIKDKTFFFLSYEGLHLLQPRQITQILPSVALRASAAPNVRPYLDAFPLPNGPAVDSNRAMFTAAYSNPSRLDATSIRVDQRFGPALRIFGRYNDAPSNAVSRALGNGFTGAANNLQEAHIDTRTATGGVTWILTPTMSNDVRMNWSHVDSFTRFTLDTFGGAQPMSDAALFSSPYDRSNAALSLQVNDGTAGWTDGAGTNNVQAQLNFVDTMSWQVGGHFLKFGVDYRSLSPFDNARPYTQSYLFRNVALAATGITTSASTSARRPVGMSFHNISLFAQDTWRPTPRATLTYGVRWDRNPPPSTTTPSFTVANPGDVPAAWTLAPAGTPLYQTTNINFAPRVGLAYQLNQSPEWGSVVRGGTGLFYDLGTAGAGVVAGNWPNLSSLTVRGLPVPVRGADATPPPFGTLPINFIFLYDPKLTLPRVYHFNMAYEQAVGARQSVTLTYVAALGRGLLHGIYGEPHTATFSGSYTRFENGGRSTYGALQVQFQRRMSNGLQFLAYYALANAKDTSSDNWLDPDVTPVLSPSLFDIRHAMSSAVSYTIPIPGRVGPVGGALLGGWSIDAIVRARSATPFTVIGGDNLKTGPFGVELTETRASLVPGVPVYLKDPTAPGGLRLNRNAFLFSPADGSQGNTTRNQFRGFGMWQADITLRRQIVVGAFKCQVGAEIFNVFNNPNFADPIGNISGGSYNNLGFLFSPIFGQSTQMLGGSLGSGGGYGGLNPLYQIGAPRSVQLSLKFLF